MVAAATDVPTAFVALTDTESVVPSGRPVMTHVSSVAGLGVQLAPVDVVTAYDVTARPPSLRGADHETSALVSLVHFIAIRAVGGLGTVAAYSKTIAVLPTSSVELAVVMATTLIAYDVPLTRPVITSESSVWPDSDAPAVNGHDPPVGRW